MAEEMAPEQGQAEAPVESGQGQGDIQSQSPFFSHTYDDGEVVEFTSPEELTRHFRDGTLRHSDYTKKTQGLAEERKKFESERERHNAERAAELQAYSKWKTIDDRYRTDSVFRTAMQKALRNNDPNAAMKSMLQQELSPLQKKLDEYERQRAEDQRKQEEAEENERAFTLLQKAYTDFDRNAVEAEINRLRQTPDGDSARALFELVYHALKGRVTPGQMERSITERVKRNSNAKPPIPPTSANGTTQKEFANLREAAAEAEKKYGGL